MKYIKIKLIFCTVCVTISISFFILQEMVILAKIILSNTLTQLLYFIGAVFVIGFAISLLNRLFYKISGGGRGICYATGLLGTPIHELSHAIMCLVFFHRIEEMRLYDIDDENGVLGYVRHSYNSRNLYQVLGNYFIGIAPILGGGAVIYLATRFMMPSVYADISLHLDSFAAAAELGENWFGSTISAFSGIVKALFLGVSEGFIFWVFLIVAFCIALHMNLSGADIKGALGALPILILLLFAVNFAIGFISEEAYGEFTSVMNGVGAYLCAALLFSLILSAVCILIALIIRIIASIFVH